MDAMHETPRGPLAPNPHRVFISRLHDIRTEAMHAQTHTALVRAIDRLREATESYVVALECESPEAAESWAYARPF